LKGEICVGISLVCCKQLKCDVGVGVSGLSRFMRRANQAAQVCVL
jgi:hypothetical protein